MKKTISRMVSLISCAVLIAACVPAAVSAQKADSEYPYVFVHGMMGWGDYDSWYSERPYWGYGSADKADIVSELNENGYTCVAPSLGGLSSAWDRCCELYAELSGTVVDYGEAHSAQCNHARYGRSYEGRALLDTFGKTDENGNIIKINLLGHSFGGATIRLFASLLAYGAQEEITASGENTSPLFTGGKADWVNSVVTLSAPLNGTPLGSVVVDKLPIVLFVFSFIANLSGIKGEESTSDYQLDQFGLTTDRTTGAKASLNMCGIYNFSTAGDNCAVDMSVDGAAALNEKYPDNREVYYISYSTCGTEENKFGNQIPTDEIGSMFGIFCTYVGFCGGRVFGGVKLGEEWEANDGLVPVYSARCPIGAENAEINSGAEITQRGVWYVMPVVNGADHSYYMGTGMSTPVQYYLDMLGMLDSLA